MISLEPQNSHSIVTGPRGAVEVRHHTVTADTALVGLRLDRALARALPEYSRVRLRQWIDAGQVRVDGRVARARDPVRAGDRIEVTATLAPMIADAPEAIRLDLVYEDAEVLVVNKPAGLVVHPGAGNPAGTLVNALLNHAPELERLPRAGLVHRLDKGTTGLLVVARTPGAHAALVAALARRELQREYLALVSGEVVAGETIAAPIGRHPALRTRMAVSERGREALTHTRVAERLSGFTLLAVTLETGRTHQIRVHLAHRGMPVVGDPVYAGRRGLPAGLSPGARAALNGFQRQALHARRLSFAHPKTGEALSFEVPVPADFAALLAVLRSQRP